METIKSCLSKYQITLKQKHEEAKTNHEKRLLYTLGKHFTGLASTGTVMKIKGGRHSRTVEMPETFCTLSMFELNCPVCAWLV